MKIVRVLVRIVAPLGLVILAACQTMPANETTTATKPETTLQASSKGAAVAVFLADTTPHPGWRAVKIQSGVLYVNPQPIVTREDLVGIRAGSNKEGEGLLALALNEVGHKKVMSVTAQNPNKRLALVVGRTMLAAPSYTTGVTSNQLVFGVGTEQNATAAAREIAGVDARPANGSK